MILTIKDELPGSKLWAVLVKCGPKALKRMARLKTKNDRIEPKLQINNLHVNLYLINNKEDIENLIMDNHGDIMCE